MKNPLGQRGAVDILLIALLAAIIGVGGYAFWHYQQASRGVTITNDAGTKKKAATPTPTPVASADPYAGWAQFAGTCSGYRFKYPSNWVSTTEPGFPPGTGCDRYTYTTPDGNKLAWVPSPYADGPGCETDGGNCVWDTITSSETLNGKDSRSTAKIVKRVACNDTDHTKCQGQIILASPDSSNSLAYTVGARREYPIAQFDSGKWFYMLQGASGSLFSTSFIYTEASARAWLATPDVKDVVLVMKSLTK